MPKVAILGAGAMGSGLANALVQAGWDVNLWGTWLDDHLIDAIEEGRPHPRINVVISGKVHPFRSAGLEDALDGVDVVVVSVASQGVPKVTEMALPGIAKAKALWLTSKGFMPVDGKILLLPEGIRSIAKAADVELPPIVAIAGPVKANECAAGEPTATIFGCKSRDVAVEFARAARSEHYCIEATDDEVGVEICAPMKNVYAIMLGIADGLEEKTGKPHHNLKAATFNEAVREMSILSTALGADPATAYGLPGVGDLEVTGLSGRNKVYGMRIGGGERADEALAEMTAAEQTVEGVPAVEFALRFVQQRHPRLIDDLPLLVAVHAVVHQGRTADDIKEAALSLSDLDLPSRPPTQAGATCPIPPSYSPSTPPPPRPRPSSSTWTGTPSPRPVATTPATPPGPAGRNRTPPTGGGPQPRPSGRSPGNWRAAGGRSCRCA